MASSKPKELGKYSEVSSLRDGKPQNEERSSIEITLARECAGCGKHIKKGKMQLVCACKLVIYCSEDCEQSSSHRCGGYQPSNKTAENIIRACFERFERDRAAIRGPSTDKINKLVEKIHGDKGRLLSLAEEGDPIAALIIGSAYVERRVKKGTGSDEWCFSMPPQYLKKSFLETNEIAVKWLKVAAEGGVAEAMFLLYIATLGGRGCGLEVDKRVGIYWLDKAYRTGGMDYLIEILVYGCQGFLAGNFENLSDLVYGIENHSMVLSGPTLRHLLMATRWKELKRWGGKTAMGEPFYGWRHFEIFMDKVGGLEATNQGEASFASAKKKCIEFEFTYGRPGSQDVLLRSAVSKKRKESNLKFRQGMRVEENPDFQLVRQGVASPVQGRTSYKVTCKHTEPLGLEPESAQQLTGPPGSNLGKKDMNLALSFNNPDNMNRFKKAGNCQPCTEDALQRLGSVAQGSYSISLNEVIPVYSYHATRYANESGVIIQDIFKAYSKPDLRQVLQCLMTNPADLHPLAVAEDQTLYWGIIWYWGSVYHAVQDTCDQNTLRKIFGTLVGNSTNDWRANFPGNAESRNANASSLAAFPESAAGEWRVACGNEDCPVLDHEVKFNLCAGCKVRRYCNEVCQGKDWIKHKKFCKAGK